MPELFLHKKLIAERHFQCGASLANHIMEMSRMTPPGVDCDVRTEYMTDSPGTVKLKHIPASIFNRQERYVIDIR